METVATSEGVDVGVVLEAQQGESENLEEVRVCILRIDGDDTCNAPPGQRPQYCGSDYNPCKYGSPN